MTDYNELPVSIDSERGAPCHNYWGPPQTPPGELPPDPLAVFNGPTSKGRERNGRARRRSGRKVFDRRGVFNKCMYVVCKMEGRGEEVEGEVWSTQQCCRDAPYVQYTLLQTDRQTTL